MNLFFPNIFHLISLKKPFNKSLLYWTFRRLDLETQGRTNLHSAYPQLNSNSIKSSFLWLLQCTSSTSQGDRESPFLSLRIDIICFDETAKPSKQREKPRKFSVYHRVRELFMEKWKILSHTLSQRILSQKIEKYCTCFSVMLDFLAIESVSLRSRLPVDAKHWKLFRSSFLKKFPCRWEKFNFECEKFSWEIFLSSTTFSLFFSRSFLTWTSWKVNLCFPSNSRVCATFSNVDKKAKKMCDMWKILKNFITNLFN